MSEGRGVVTDDEGGLRAEDNSALDWRMHRVIWQTSSLKKKKVVSL
jgi:hypothetical protein